MEKTEAAKAARIAVQDASDAWNAAPYHIRAAAGQWVCPILIALERIANALEGANDARKL